MLKNSSKKFLKKNILYYCDGSDQNTLSYISGRRHRVPKEQDKLLVERMKNIAANIKNQAKQLKPNYVILSSERFFSLTPDEIKTIDYLGITFTEAYCIVYVRNPDEFYLSRTQQKVKASHKIPNPFAYQRDIASALTTWQNFVGASNFMGTTFDRKALFKGDVVADFIKKIETITQENIEVKEWTSENESITAEQMVLLQEYRRDFLHDFNNQFMPSSSNLLKFFLEINALKKFGSKSELKTEIKEAILFNNKENIASANKILSGPSKLNCIDFTENPHLPASWDGKRPRKVKDILSSFDSVIYRTLKKIIIEYNDNLKPGFERYLSAFNDDERTKEQAAIIYLKYLETNDYFSAEQLKQYHDLTDRGHVYALKNLLELIDSTKARQAQ